MSQRIYSKKEKNIPGWGYWGNFGEIELGISSGVIDSSSAEQEDKLHYHKTGVIFVLCLSGEGQVEVNGEIFSIKKDELLRIEPGEKYRHIGASKVPFYWITICTVKDLEDKVFFE